MTFFRPTIKEGLKANDEMSSIVTFTHVYVTGLKEVPVVADEFWSYFYNTMTYTNYIPYETIEIGGWRYDRVLDEE